MPSQIAAVALFFDEASLAQLCASRCPHVADWLQWHSAEILDRVHRAVERQTHHVDEQHNPDEYQKFESAQANLCERVVFDNFRVELMSVLDVFIISAPIPPPIPVSQHDITHSQRLHFVVLLDDSDADIAHEFDNSHLKHNMRWVFDRCQALLIRELAEEYCIDTDALLSSLFPPQNTTKTTAFSAMQSDIVQLLSEFYPTPSLPHDFNRTLNNPFSSHREYDPNDIINRDDFFSNTFANSVLSAADRHSMRTLSRSLSLLPSLLPLLHSFMLSFNLSVDEVDTNSHFPTLMARFGPVHEVDGCVCVNNTSVCRPLRSLNFVDKTSRPTPVFDMDIILDSNPAFPSFFERSSCLWDSTRPVSTQSWLQMAVNESDQARFNSPSASNTPQRNIVSSGRLNTSSKSDLQPTSDDYASALWSRLFGVLPVPSTLSIMAGHAFQRAQYQKHCKWSDSESDSDAEEPAAPSRLWHTQTLLSRRLNTLPAFRQRLSPSEHSRGKYRAAARLMAASAVAERVRKTSGTNAEEQHDDISDDTDSHTDSVTISIESASPLISDNSELSLTHSVFLVPDTFTLWDSEKEKLAAALKDAVQLLSNDESVSSTNKQLASVSLQLTKLNPFSTELIHLLLSCCQLQLSTISSESLSSTLRTLSVQLHRCLLISTFYQSDLHVALLRPSLLAELWFTQPNVDDDHDAEQMTHSFLSRYAPLDKMFPPEFTPQNLLLKARAHFVHWFDEVKVDLAYSHPLALVFPTLNNSASSSQPTKLSSDSALSPRNLISSLLISTTSGGGRHTLLKQLLMNSSLTLSMPEQHSPLQVSFQPPVSTRSRFIPAVTVFVLIALKELLSALPVHAQRIRHEHHRQSGGGDVDTQIDIDYDDDDTSSFNSFDDIDDSDNYISESDCDDMESDVEACRVHLRRVSQQKKRSRHRLKRSLDPFLLPDEQHALHSLVKLLALLDLPPASASLKPAISSYNHVDIALLRRLQVELQNTTVSDSSDSSETEVSDVSVDSDHNSIEFAPDDIKSIVFIDRHIDGSFDLQVTTGDNTRFRFLIRPAIHTVHDVNTQIQHCFSTSSLTDVQVKLIRAQLNSAMGIDDQHYLKVASVSSLGGPPVAVSAVGPPASVFIHSNKKPITLPSQPAFHSVPSSKSHPARAIKSRNDPNQNFAMNQPLSSHSDVSLPLCRLPERVKSVIQTLMQSAPVQHILNHASFSLRLQLVQAHSWTAIKHFLVDRLDTIGGEGYVPSEMDILLLPAHAQSMVESIELQQHRQQRVDIEIKAGQRSTFSPTDQILNQLSVSESALFNTIEFDMFDHRPILGGPGSSSLQLCSLSLPRLLHIRQLNCNQYSQLTHRLVGLAPKGPGFTRSSDSRHHDPERWFSYHNHTDQATSEWLDGWDSVSLLLDLTLLFKAPTKAASALKLSAIMSNQTLSNEPTQHLPAVLASSVSADDDSGAFFSNRPHTDDPAREAALPLHHREHMMRQHLRQMSQRLDHDNLQVWNTQAEQLQSTIENLDSMQGPASGLAQSVHEFWTKLEQSSPSKFSPKLFLELLVLPGISSKAASAAQRLVPPPSMLFSTDAIFALFPSYPDVFDVDKLIEPGKLASSMTSNRLLVREDVELWQQQYLLLANSLKSPTRFHAAGSGSVGPSAEQIWARLPPSTLDANGDALHSPGLFYSALFSHARALGLNDALSAIQELRMPLREFEVNLFWTKFAEVRDSLQCDSASALLILYHTFPDLLIAMATNSMFHVNYSSCFAASSLASVQRHFVQQLSLYYRSVCPLRVVFDILLIQSISQRVHSERLEPDSVVNCVFATDKASPVDAELSAALIHTINSIIVDSSDRQRVNDSVDVPAFLRYLVDGTSSAVLVSTRQQFEDQAAVVEQSDSFSVSKWSSQLDPALLEVFHLPADLKCCFNEVAARTLLESMLLPRIYQLFGRADDAVLHPDQVYLSVFNHSLKLTKRHDMLRSILVDSLDLHSVNLAIEQLSQSSAHRDEAQAISSTLQTTGLLDDGLVDSTALQQLERQSELLIVTSVQFSSSVDKAAKAGAGLARSRIKRDASDALKDKEEHVEMSGIRSTDDKLRTSTVSSVLPKPRQLTDEAPVAIPISTHCEPEIVSTDSILIQSNVVPVIPFPSPRFDTPVAPGYPTLPIPMPMPMPLPMPSPMPGPAPGPAESSGPIAVPISGPVPIAPGRTPVREFAMPMPPGPPPVRVVAVPTASVVVPIAPGPPPPPKPPISTLVSAGVALPSSKPARPVIPTPAISMTAGKKPVVIDMPPKVAIRRKAARAQDDSSELKEAAEFGKRKKKSVRRVSSDDAESDSEVVEPIAAEERRVDLQTKSVHVLSVDSDVDEQEETEEAEKQEEAVRAFDDDIAIPALPEDMFNEEIQSSMLDRNRIMDEDEPIDLETSHVDFSFPIQDQLPSVQYIESFPAPEVPIIYHDPSSFDDVTFVNEVLPQPPVPTISTAPIRPSRPSRLPKQRVSDGIHDSLPVSDTLLHQLLTQQQRTQQQPIAAIQPVRAPVPPKPQPLNAAQLARQKKRQQDRVDDVFADMENACNGLAAFMISCEPTWRLEEVIDPEAVAEPERSTTENASEEPEFITDVDDSSENEPRTAKNMQVEMQNFNEVGKPDADLLQAEKAIEAAMQTPKEPQTKRVWNAEWSSLLCFHWPLMLFTYLLTGIAVLLVLLPAAFVVLVARAKKVETKVDKMAQRAEVLAKETRAEKTLRVFTLLIRAIPMWFLLWAWPALTTWYWLPNLSSTNQNRERLVMLILGLQLVLILVLQLLGAFRAVISFTEHTRTKLFNRTVSLVPAIALAVTTPLNDDNTPSTSNQKSMHDVVVSGPTEHHEVTWAQLLTKDNAIIFVSLLVEVFQLSTFAIQQLAPVVVASNTTAFNLSSVSAPHSAALMFHDSRIVPVVFQTLSNSTAASSASWGSDIGLVISALYLDFTRLSPATIFTAQTWIAVGLVGLLLLLCIIQILVELREFGWLKEQKQTEKANNFFFHSFFGAVIYGHGVLKTVPNWLRSMVALLADSLLLLLLNRMLAVFTCDYSAAGSATVRALPEMQCWSGSHRGLAFASLIAFSMYLPLTSMIAPMLSVQCQDAADLAEQERAEGERLKKIETLIEEAKEKRHASRLGRRRQCSSDQDDEKREDAEIRAAILRKFAHSDAPPPPVSIAFIKPYLSLVAIAKCTMTVCGTFFGGGTQLALVLSSAGLCLFLLFATAAWVRIATPHSAGTPISHGYLAPSAHQSILTLRLLGFAGGVWGAVVGAVAVSQVAWSFQQQLIAVLSGVGIMFAVIMALFYTKRHTPHDVPKLNRRVGITQ